MHLLKLPNFSRFNVVLMCIFLTPQVWANWGGDLRYGLGLGLGGTGITKDQTVASGQSVTVNRSDGPLVLSFFLDYQFMNRFILSLEDSRGIKFAPYSAGIIFTGGAIRWFFDSEPPSLIQTKNSFLMLKRLSPYVGFGTGIASANIDRPSDQIESTTGSGIYFSYKLGMDYQMAPNYAIRPEITYSTSLPPNYGPSTILKEFAIQCGVYFFL